MLYQLDESLHTVQEAFQDALMPVWLQVGKAYVTGVPRCPPPHRTAREHAPSRSTTTSLGSCF